MKIFINMSHCFVGLLLFSLTCGLRASAEERAESAKPWKTIRDAHTDPIGSVAFSPNGKLLAAGGGDKTLRFWQIPDEKAEKR